MFKPLNKIFHKSFNYSSFDCVDTMLTDECENILSNYDIDFAFLYLVDTDEEGHRYGWLSKQYLNKVYIAIENVKRMFDKFKDEYHIISHEVFLNI